ncbi:hypothetical protein MPDQ_006628 [Monascus purpureus]|uniref:Phosphatidate phosphatase APP1 catalytic domain-containing protein n=1 Tax=Monascus purpureus TaxID=5098 RepID=A0A507R6W5_MONPU|nr:hypothetical protein MPDQ_006628 [Monascus purpureus]BDD60650.1 hypothetical protein MAP00_005756 [Monascus purpureus]
MPSPYTLFAEVIRYVTGFLHGKTAHLPQPADPQQHTVWLLDTTAYRYHYSPSGRGLLQPWHAEIVACVFVTNAKRDTGELVAKIADRIGLDGKAGAGDPETLKRIEERLHPFLDPVAPGKIVKLKIPVPIGHVQTHHIGPSDSSGVSSQDIHIGRHHVEDGAVLHPSLQHWDHPVSMSINFAAPEGWLVISDIDDTIKHTQTPDLTGILRTTFADEPKPIEGMPQQYSHVKDQLAPTWFYVSASPYNLYPFLRGFVDANYPHGPLLLRTYSMMSLQGLHESLTKGVYEFKTSQINKIYEWLPQRRVLCVGDSTQKDPETYAEMYKTHPGWIRAIFIRKVTDAPNMNGKNKAERFDAAFKDVPRDVWKVFEHPDELHELVNELKTKAN